MGDVLTPGLVETAWPLRNVTRVAELQRTPSGDRVVVLFEADEGRFVGKVASSWVTRESLARSLDAFVLLPARGFTAVPGIVATRGGELYAEQDGRFAYLLAYVEGTDTASTPVAYAKLGALIGDLHALGDYPHDTEFDPDLLA